MKYKRGSFIRALMASVLGVFSVLNFSGGCWQAKCKRHLIFNLQAFVGYPNASHYHVFELTRQLPRFSMYSLIDRLDYILFKLL
jgi:hypothetical protein